MPKNRNPPPKPPRPNKGKGKGKAPQRNNQLLGRQYGPKGSSQAFGTIAGGAIGTFLGGPAGTVAGAAIGGAAGHFVSEITGLGDYKIRRNIFAPGTAAPTIRNANNRKGALVVRHREFLGDIITSSVAGTFNLQSFSLNPGLDASYPFLSQIAQNYEEYSMQGCFFEFRSMSGDALNSVNTALGSVIMATSYNASNPLFLSKAEMDSYEFATSTRPSQSCIHMIECDPNQSVLGELYVRTGVVPSGTDVRMYDLGNFQIATSGMQGASVNIGELWVTYQVALLKPKLYAALGNGNGFAHYAVASTVSNADPLGDGSAATWIRSAGSSLSLVRSGDGFIFPLSPQPQSYLVTVSWSGGAAVIAYPSVTASLGATNGTYITNSVLFPADNDFFSPSAGATSTALTYQVFLLVTANSPNAQFVFGSAGTLPTSSIVDVKVLQMPNLSY